MNVGVIIYSRLDSKRLPGKALLDISGRPMLGRVIDRARRIKGVDHIIVATSSRPIDDPIALFAISESVEVFRGSVDDVGERTLGVCDKYELTKFARICGDRPFFDPEVVTRLIEIHNKLNVDIATTMCPRTYPPGLTGEVVSTLAFQKAMKRTNHEADREHITSYFYRNAHEFSIHNLDAPQGLDMEGIRLVVDDKSDLERARCIASRLGNDSEVFGDMPEVVKLAREWDCRQ